MLFEIVCAIHTRERWLNHGEVSCLSSGYPLIISSSVSADFSNVFEDVPTFLVGWFCPCYLFGQNAEQIDGSSKIGMCLGYFCLSSCYLVFLLHKPRREKLRHAFNLVETPNDCLCTFLFSPCANIQEAREMKLRGMFSTDAGMRCRNLAIFNLCFA